MTDTALAATLFGAEDLRMVERPLGTLAPGFVRVRFGAGGICGSDMHYFRHARTGDFVVTSPLVLGHEVAGESSRTRRRRHRPSRSETTSRSTRRAGAATAPAAARAGENLCENIYFMGSASKTPHMQGGFATCSTPLPAQCVRCPTSCRAVRGGGPGRAAGGLPARGHPRRRRRARPSPYRRRPDRPADHAGGTRSGAPRERRWSTSPGAARLRRRASAPTTSSISPADAERPEALAAERGRRRCSRLPGQPPALASAIGTVRRGGTVVQLGNLPGGDMPVAAQRRHGEGTGPRRLLPLRQGVRGSRRPDRLGQGRCAEAGDGANARSPTRTAAFLLALDRTPERQGRADRLTAHDSTRGRDIAATDRPDPWPRGRETLLYPFARH